MRIAAEALLVQTLSDTGAPIALRVSCARTILRLTGDLADSQSNQDDSLDPDGLTAEGIDRELQRLK